MGQARSLLNIIENGAPYNAATTLHLLAGVRAKALSDQDMKETFAMRILIVDDDVPGLETIKVFLTSVGFEDVRTAASSRQALLVLESNNAPFNCIIIENSMPDLTGPQLLLEIRGMKAYKDVPVVMMLNFRDTEQISETLPAGTFDYIMKPFDMSELEARIRNIEKRSTDKKSADNLASDPPVSKRFDSEMGIFEEAQANGQPRGKVLDQSSAKVTKNTRATLGVLTMIVDNFDGVLRKFDAEVVDAYLVELAKQLNFEFSSLQSIICY